MIAVGFTANLNAQIEYRTTDGFFLQNKSTYRSEHSNELMPMLPSSYNSIYDFDATGNNNTPLGTGLLLLTGMAMTYSMKKKK